jgi:RNA polymerase sigma-70 factor (ECF subfamily)
MEQTDEGLMRAVRDGDVRKLGVLFDRYHTTLFNFFCRMTGDRTVAEDLVQDVFFRMLKYRKTFRDEGSFARWMFHIARNARIDYVRKYPAEVPILQDGIERPSPAPFPGQQLERDQDHSLLNRALFELPQDKRELLVLVRYQELKYEQVAQLLNVDVGTLKVRVHRALKELREIFNRLSDERSECKPVRSVSAIARNLKQ